MNTPLHQLGERTPAEVLARIPTAKLLRHCWSASSTWSIASGRRISVVSDAVRTAQLAAGARLKGGRWNSPGKDVLYASDSLALCCLEVLVHLENRGIYSNVLLLLN